MQKYLYFAVLDILERPNASVGSQGLLLPALRPFASHHMPPLVQKLHQIQIRIRIQIQVQILVFNREARSPFCSCCSSHQIKCLLNTETLPNTNRNTSVGSQGLILPAARHFSPSLVRKMYKIEKTKTVLGLNAESTVKSIWILN